MPLYCNDNNRSNFIGFIAVLKLSTVNVWTTPALCSQCTTYSCCVLWVVRCSQVQLQWETSLRVKLQRPEKNFAAETKLEPCLNHTQSLPCHWAYLVVPTNNHLIFVIKKKQTKPKAFLQIGPDYIWVWNQVFLALEPDNIFICSFSSSFDCYTSNHASFSFR